MADALNEQARRALMRKIADAPPAPGWRDGTCDRCGTETLVTGPVVQPLCVYCDQLRVLPPLPVPKPPQPPVRPARSPLQLHQVRRRLVGTFCCLGILMLAIPSEVTQTLAVCLFGMAILWGATSW